jgi:hypothetical protein
VIPVLTMNVAVTSLRDASACVRASSMLFFIAPTLGGSLASRLRMRISTFAGPDR